MCMLCVEWEKQKITSKEAYKAINEMLPNSKREQSKHLLDLAERIISTEVPETKADEELEKSWSDETYKR